MSVTASAFLIGVLFTVQKARKPLDGLGKGSFGCPFLYVGLVPEMVYSKDIPGSSGVSDSPG